MKLGLLRICHPLLVHQPGPGCKRGLPSVALLVRQENRIRRRVWIGRAGIRRVRSGGAGARARDQANDERYSPAMLKARSLLSIDAVHYSEFALSEIIPEAATCSMIIRLQQAESKV
jgi:hypothetical protein